MNNKTYANMTAEERLATMPFNSRNLVQVNLPPTAHYSALGKGETIWVELTTEGKRQYGMDRSGYVTGIVRNDSFFYPTLRYGDEIQVRLRSRKKPFVPFEENLSGLDFNILAESYRDENAQYFPTQLFHQVRGLNNSEHLSVLTNAALDKFRGVFLHPLATPQDIADLRMKLTPEAGCCAECYNEIIDLSR